MHAARQFVEKRERYSSVARERVLHHYIYAASWHRAGAHDRVQGDSWTHERHQSASAAGVPLGDVVEPSSCN